MKKIDILKFQINVTNIKNKLIFVYIVITK